VKVVTWISFLLGLWLIAAGFILSSGARPVMTEEIVVGIVIACLALAATVTESAVLNWLIAVAGLWTLIAPAAVSYVGMHTSRANDIVVGIVVLVLGVANALNRQTPVRTTA
jgi:hypothetical protein